MNEQLIALIVFIACFSLLILRRIKIVYVSLSSAVILIFARAVSPSEAFHLIDWNVLAVYWGFGMLSIAFAESRVPSLIAFHLLRRAGEERYAIFYLCALATFLSAFMPNPLIVMLLAPIAIEVARKTKSSLFDYLVSLAVSSNVATTITMVADPPALILAQKTGMRFLDFYWYKNRPGLGTLSIVGALMFLLTLFLIFRKKRGRVSLREEKIEVSYGASFLFIAGVLALALLPFPPGLVGATVGMMALLLSLRRLHRTLREFDWETLLFILGLFVVVGSLDSTGVLARFASWLANQGIRNPSLLLALFVWLSVALSSFIDNVPYTLLMVPVCQDLASAIGMSPLPLLYGMVVGTGIGGNILPVGATANVIACGMLEKRGYKIELKRFLRISVLPTFVAVAVTHALLQLFWV
jgi:Na+/H+ antiporter NhaD/arsenite permease-like protein